MSQSARCARLFPAVLACGWLAGCSPGFKNAAHTVDWYLAHAADRDATVQRCASDPGSLENTPDCINATAAAQRADIGSLKSLPPLGLTNGKGRQMRLREGRSGER